MGSGKLGRFQSRGVVGWQGMTKDNALAAVFQSAPQKATNVMVQVMQRRGQAKALELMLAKLPTKEFDNDDEYTWDVISSSRRNITLLEARDEDGRVVTDNGKMVGAGTAPFYLVFGEDWFGNGEWIVGNLNELYPFRILEDGRAEGDRTVYKVELGGGNMDGIPSERLLFGEKFSVDAAYIEKELSRKVGTVRFSAPTSMRNEFSRVRIQYKVPGTMIDKKLQVGIPYIDQNGNKQVATKWMNYVDYEVEMQFSEYKNNALMFGRSNRNENGEYTNIGKSGGVIKVGAGLLQQIEVSNTNFYNDFSIKMLEDALYNLSTSNLEIGDRTFLIKTGRLYLPVSYRNVA